MRQRTIAIHPDIAGTGVAAGLLRIGCRLIEYTGDDVTRDKVRGVFGFVTADRTDTSLPGGFAGLGIPALAVCADGERTAVGDPEADADILCDQISDRLLPEDLLARIIQLRRLSRARQELTMRRGEKLVFGRSGKEPYQILCAAEPALIGQLIPDDNSDFALIHALSGSMIPDVIGSTTPDAILIAGKACNTGMGTFLRGHPDYRFLPLLGLADSSSEIPEGLTDIFGPGVDPEVFRARLKRLAGEEFHRRRVNAGLFAAGQQEAEKRTGLMTSDRFVEHLSNYLEMNPAVVRLASIVTPPVHRENSAGPVAAAIQLATRAEDTATYFGDGRFAILIADDEDEGRDRIEHRLRSILKHTLITIDDLSGDTVSQWEFGASAALPGDSASELIDRAFSCAS